MSERYQILERIGRGGMSAVYRARDTLMGRDVAIKRLLPIEETRLNDADVAAISREAEALSRFQHPNVITIYALEEDREGPYFVMELVTGEDLHEIIREGALSWPDFRDVAPQCLDPLVVAGGLNLLHRDIKPGNLMLTRTGSGRFVVKLLDFGLAKFSQQPSLQTLDQSGSFLGSIDYIAPEQLELQPLDQRTDLYSLGCVFYYMLAQVSPFSGDNPAATSMNHLRHRCRPIGEIRPDVPAEVADWIMRLIAREPEDRPADADEALRQWNDALFGRPYRRSAEVTDGEGFLADPGPPELDPVPVKAAVTVPAPAPVPKLRTGVAPSGLPLPPRDLTRSKTPRAPVEGPWGKALKFWGRLPPTGKWIALASILVVILVESLLLLRKPSGAGENLTVRFAEPVLITETLPPLSLPSAFPAQGGSDAESGVPPLPVTEGIFARFSGGGGTLGRDYRSSADPGGRIAAWVNLADPRPVRSLLRDPADPTGRHLPARVVRDSTNVLGLKGSQRGLMTTNRTYLVSPRSTEDFEKGATVFFVARIVAGDDRPYRLQAPVGDGRYVALAIGNDARVTAISKGRAEGAESRASIAWPGGELGLFIHRWDPVARKQSLTGIAATVPDRPYFAEAELEYEGPPLGQVGYGRRGFNDGNEFFTGNVTFEFILYQRVLGDEEIDRVSRHLQEFYFSWNR